MSEDVTRRVGRFFDGYAAQFDSIYGHAGRRSWAGRLVDRTWRRTMFRRFREVLRRTADPAVRSVLDVGCGPGRYLVEFAGQGKQVVGLDISAEMLEVARARLAAAGREGVALVHASYLDYRSPEPVDVAVLMGFMDYVEDARPILAKLAREARRAYVSFPKREGFLAWQRAVRYRRRDCPLYLYSGDEVRRLLDGAGWQGRYEILDLGRDRFVAVGPSG
ncbi:MAG: class I SAM-dependent DNA methyltransferase [Thermoanaerobaculia bacterium]